MALDFPSSPSSGDLHAAANGLTYAFDGVKWKSLGTYGSSVADVLKLDDISASFNSSTTTFDLKNGGTSVAPGSPQSLLISVGGVVQEPTTSYTISATAKTITFTEAPTTGTDFWGILYSQIPQSTGIAQASSVVDDAIDAAAIADGAISNVHINDSAAIASTKLSFTQTGTGAVARTVESRLKETFSVKDFGAVGDGSTDDTTACQNAVNAALATTNGVVYFPSGTYKLTDKLGSSSAPSSTTSISLIGIERAVLDFQPSVYLNYGIIFKSSASDTVGYKVVNIEGLTIDCNNKVAQAITVKFGNTGTSGATLPKYVGVKNCKIEDVKGVNNASVTVDAAAIAIQGYENVEVTNNFIKDVIRDKNADGCDATRGMTITDSHIVNITNNYIEDISHGGQGSPSDSDGIVVFSNKSITGRYDRDLVNISNNYIKDCDGRFIKLQTGGHCTVSGNLMKLEKAMTLIEYWKGIDVQGGNSTIVNNRMHIGSEYGGAGGANSMLLQVQRAADTNADYNNEGHVTLVKDNVFNLEKKIKYAIGLEPIAESTNMTLIYRVHNNTIQGGADSDITGSDTTTIRPDYFLYAGGGSFPKPDLFTGKMIWDIRDNMVDCLDFLHINGGADVVDTSAVDISAETITITGHNYTTGDKVIYNNGGGTTLAGLINKSPYYVIRVDDNTIKLSTTAANAAAGTAKDLTGTGNNAQWFVPDFAGHWFLYVINNTKWPSGITRALLGQVEGEVQTSSLCVSGNTNGKESLNVDYSIDFSDLLAGCNFGAGAGLRTRMGPTSWPTLARNSNIRKERCWVVENEKQTYISTDPTVGWDYDDPAEELTIASGVITVTGKLHTVDTESDASTDDLDTINEGRLGQIVILRAANDGRTIVCKDGTGNLRLSGDFSLTHTEDGIVLINDGTNWIELSTANNAS